MVVQRDAKHELTWYENNAKYEAMGAAEIPQYNPELEGDLEQMNRGKVGRPYKYFHPMMACVAITRVMWGKSYRKCSGKLKRCWPDKTIPNFCTIWKRVGASMPRFKPDEAFRPKPGSTVRLAADSTGMKNSNMGEWIRVKWNVKRGFFKIHILVNLDTRRILEFCLTDMNRGDAAQLPGLMKGLLKEYVDEGAPLPEPVAEIVVDSASKEEAAPLPDRSQTLMDRWLPGGDPEAPVEAEHDGEDDVEDHTLMRMHRAPEERGISMELRGDGAYDARYVFSLLNSLNITPLISVHIDSNPRDKGKDRDRAVLDQLGWVGGCTSRELGRMTKSERRANQKNWREHVKFGLRWLVDIVTSAFKRVFGESVRALQPHTACVEVATKITAYNHALDVGDKAVGAVRAGAPRHDAIVPLGRAGRSCAHRGKERDHSAKRHTGRAAYAHWNRNTGKSPHGAPCGRSPPGLGSVPWRRRRIMKQSRGGAG